MKLFTSAATLFLLSTLTVQAATPSSSRLKGFYEVQTLLNQRLGNPGQVIDLGSYLGAGVHDSSQSILDLLGVYGPDSTFKNGSSNSLNFLLWYLMFDSFSTDLESSCTPTATPPSFLAPEVIQTFAKFCATDLNSDSAEAALNGIWYSVMGFEPPDAERQAWISDVKEFQFNSPGVSAPEKLKFSLMLIFLNPYFLLEN